MVHGGAYVLPCVNAVARGSPRQRGPRVHSKACGRTLTSGARGETHPSAVRTASPFAYSQPSPLQHPAPISSPGPFGASPRRHARSCRTTFQGVGVVSRAAQRPSRRVPLSRSLPAALRRSQAPNALAGAVSVGCMRVCWSVLCVVVCRVNSGPHHG
jgi:hypothetical protein